MKLIEFKEYNSEGEKKLNKRKVVIALIFVVIFLVLMILSILYVYNENYRAWTDSYVLMKNVKQGKCSSINISSDENISVYAYDKYVALLNNNKLEIYNSSAKKTETIDVSVSNPIFTSEGRYLALAEKDKQKMYLIAGNKKLWSKDIDGTISRLSVNANGYVSLVCTGTTYKSVIIALDPGGKELFKTYIPNNNVVDSEISSDNKNLSFIEVDTSGTLIKSVVKTISMKEAQNSSENSIVNTYDMPTNVLAVNLKYQGSKNLICMCDDGINLLSNGNVTKIMNFKEENKNYSFAGIDLTNTVFEIEEISDGISNQSSNVKLLNTGTKSSKSYSISGIAKATSSTGDTIAINLGTEVYFINTRGLLRKKYIATEEIRNVIISDRIAAIVFRDQIEILLL